MAARISAWSSSTIRRSSSVTVIAPAPGDAPGRYSIQNV